MAKTTGLNIALDARRVRDFGVGTYIRNLVQALAAAGTDPPLPSDLVRRKTRAICASALPLRNRRLSAPRSSSRFDHLALPRLIRRLRADVTHIPFHRVPLFLDKPYAVTIHDLSSLFYDDASGLLHAVRGFRLRRGLERASGIIAVSGATQRDVMNLVPDAAGRIRLIYNAPDPLFLQRRLPDSPGVTGAQNVSRERLPRILERYQIRYPFLLYAGSIRPQKNIPRLDRGVRGGAKRS